MDHAQRTGKSSLMAMLGRDIPVNKVQVLGVYNVVSKGICGLCDYLI